MEGREEEYKDFVCFMKIAYVLLSIGILIYKSIHMLKINITHFNFIYMLYLNI